MVKKGWWSYQDSRGDLVPCRVIDNQLDDNCIKVRVGLFFFGGLKH